MEHSPVGIVITDTSGVIEYVNPGFTLITGYESSEVLGETLQFLKSGHHDDEFYRSMWETLKNGDVWKGEIHNRKKDGDSNWVLSVISPMHNADGDVTHYISTMQDISEKKQMEQLRETIDHVMRHDLRSPLNAIVNVPPILIEMGGLSQDQIELLRAVENSGRLMVSMIDSSLNMLKMELGSYETRREPVDLIQILENVIHQNGVLIQRTSVDVAIVVDGHDVTTDTRIQVFSDKTSLYTMFSNLVVNAIEASSADKPIHLRVDTASPLTVSIVNQGTVPVAIREKFFEKFATSGKKKGTGLGTYSAKLIADTLGYAINMNTSDETNQTTVTITMHGAESEA